MNKTIDLQEIIDFIGNNIIKIEGDFYNILVTNIRKTEEIDKNSLDWIDSSRSDAQQIAEDSKAKVIICDNSVLYSKILAAEGKILVKVENPRLTIALISEHFFINKKITQIHPTSVIDPDAIIGDNVYLGPFTVIGKCTIGDRAILLGNNFIDDNVIIGSDTIIQAGVVIGNEGHNYIRDNQNKCIKFPHLGGVIIGDNVEIGSNSFISRGVLGNTVIKEGTKIAQLVYIGANVQVGIHCAIRPNVMISGSVVIGDYCILAPSSTIREHKKLANNAFIGLGAIVTKDVPANEIWIGNPAKKMDK